MSAKLSPRVTTVLPLAIPLILLGWGALYYLIQETEPSGGTRWALFFCSVLGVTGLALPLMAFLNRRFPSLPPATLSTILRQAIWAGIYFPLLAWLRIGRVLTPSLALLLAVGFLLIEGLLRLIERSLWKQERTI